jgi:AraC-like DNA-binding protein
MGASPALVRAWQPAVPGVVEVLHAFFPDHAYPMHTHDAWTVLVVDEGTVRYDLERHEHATARSRVTLLPPYVAHDGRSVTAEGFRKRVFYLEPDRIDVTLLGQAVDRPEWVDASLRAAVDGLHGALAQRGEELEAEVRLALVTERLHHHLARLDPAPPMRRAHTLASRLRELLDAHVVEGITLEAASATLDAAPSHLVRAFARETGISPHRYLTGRRVDLARRRLLGGASPADVAVAVGFYDQAHLTRHFRRVLGVTPGAYAVSASR